MRAQWLEVPVRRLCAGFDGFCDFLKLRRTKGRFWYGFCRIPPLWRTDQDHERGTRESWCCSRNNEKSDYFSNLRAGVWRQLRCSVLLRRVRVHDLDTQTDEWASGWL